MIITTIILKYSKAVFLAMRLVFEELSGILFLDKIKDLKRNLDS